LFKWLNDSIVKATRVIRIQCSLVQHAVMIRRQKKKSHSKTTVSFVLMPTFWLLAFFPRIIGFLWKWLHVDRCGRVP